MKFEISKKFYKDILKANSEIQIKLYEILELIQVSEDLSNFDVIYKIKI